MTSLSDRQILLGKIVGVYGVQGWVKVESYTEPKTQIFNYRSWILKKLTKTVVIQNSRGREHGKGLVAALVGVTDRDQAMAWMDSEIWISRADLPKPKPGEYYWADLEGLDVVTMEGVLLGRVSHLVATGANDVMLVRDGKQERLIPFVLESYVKTVDFGTGQITVDWDPAF